MKKIIWSILTKQKSKQFYQKIEKLVLAPYLMVI